MKLEQGPRARALSRVVGDKAADHLVARWGEVKARRTGRALARKLPVLREQTGALQALHNKHQGETCVIIGNGPSLRQTDVSLLRDVVTFGLNRVYLAFDEWGFDTTYHVAVNKYVAEQSGDELARVRSPLFTTVSNVDAFRGSERQPFYLMNHRNPGFYGDVTKGVWEGATVTYVAMQIAFHMGFRRAVLVGVDHRFASQGPAHQLVESTSADPNHFDPRYFGPGYRWQLPDLETSEIAYTLAREAWAADGREILDATVDGALTVFPKIQLVDAL